MFYGYATLTPISFGMPQLVFLEFDRCFEFVDFASFIYFCINLSHRENIGIFSAVADARRHRVFDIILQEQWQQRKYDDI